jgi:uncharacterized SAM-binding protein YcdF (DUF218 family)
VKQPPAIAIFGAAVRPDGRPSGTLRRRVEAAAAFAARFPAAIFIPTGGVGRFGASEASVMARLLRQEPHPNWSIVLEETATDTLSSVRAIRHLLREHGFAGPVYAATSGYHLPRCLLLLWLAGIRARPCPPYTAPATASRWKLWYWRLREVPAIPYDAALVLWLRLVGRL